MSSKVVTSGFLLCSVMLICSFAPLISNAEAFDTDSDPVAFLPDWQLEISNIFADEPQFDEHGNVYFAVTEDNVNIGPYNIISGRGIHIIKFDPNGTWLYTESINSGNRCTNYDDGSYCVINSFNLISEDTFYIVATLRQAYSLSFSDGTSISFSSTSVYYTVVAHHDKNQSWTFAESTQENGLGSITSIKCEIDDNNELTIARLVNGDSGYDNYELRRYSTTGGLWVRDFATEEVRQQTSYWGGTSEYDRQNILIHSDGQLIHILALTDNHVKYDSQTVNCGSQGSELCYMWISINANGVRTNSVSVVHPLVTFSKFEVVNNVAYMIGNAENFSTYDDNGDDTFFDNQYQDYGNQRFTGIAAALDNTGSWVYHHSLGSFDDEEYMNFVDVDWYELTPSSYLSDGSLIINSFGSCSGDSFGLTEFQGIILNPDCSTPFPYHKSTMKIDNQGNYVWHHTVYASAIEWFEDIGVKSITTTDYSSYSLNFVIGQGLSDNNTVYGNGNSYHYALIWLDNSNGVVLDYELVDSSDQDPIAPIPIGISPLGGVINYEFGYYAVDWDADDVGSLDNCPDVYNPSQSDYDGDLEGDACDEDDDNDMVVDGIDLCSMGEMDWESNTLTDHDGDGCRDTFSEDSDDDNDGYADPFDSCPVGIVGVGNDYDADGCKDAEDLDDDNDGVIDGSDACVNGDLDWISGTVTDHDSDGCNDAIEDDDDDNDGVIDSSDDCAKGQVNWPANVNTDFDGDGCRDGLEDEDDDNDDIVNPVDQCPQSIGVADANGCTPSQLTNQNDGNQGNTFTPVVYYVCQQSSAIVTDLDDCPPVDNSSSADQQNSTSEFYFICPGGTSVVTDFADCPPIEQPEQNNITYVIDPSSNLSGNFTVCPGGKIIVSSPDDCDRIDNSQTSDGANSGTNEDGDSTETILLMFSGGAFILAIISVLIVLLRRPVPNNIPIDQTDYVFKHQPRLPSISPVDSPDATMMGTVKDGYEWIEWPEDSGVNWYRPDGEFGPWVKYK